MSSYAETSPEFTQLNADLEKVFSGYLVVKRIVRFAAIGIGIGFVSLYAGLFTAQWGLPWLALVLQWIAPVAVLAIFLSYFGGLFVTVRHGTLVASYRKALAANDIEPTAMFLRAEAGFKRARKQAIVLGLAMLSPFVFIGLFIYAVMSAKGGFH